METLKNFELPLKELEALKKVLVLFEEKLGRKTNLIDIIGEIEISHLLKYELVKDGINAGFDAVSNDKRIQIKSTRSPVTRGRISAIIKNPLNLTCGFDDIILAHYSKEMTLLDVYRMSSANCIKYFEYINSKDLSTTRKGGKLYRDMAIGQFISWAEENYNFAKDSFVKNEKQKHGL